MDTNTNQRPGTVLECSRCVMRSCDDPNLQLSDGVCNHCRRYDRLLDARVIGGIEGRNALARIVAKIRARKGPYDCIIGVSGGVDSTFVALEVKRLGLRPLAVHVDNGWDSETAVKNIESTLRKLGIDLHTEVLNLVEFYDLQRSFLLASTPDGDVPSDHAIQATLWKAARKFGVRYIISGMNFRTEAISVPSWSYGHSDWRYIRDVHATHGSVRLKRFPHFGFAELVYTSFVRRVKIVSLLNYLEYDKAQAMQQLGDELGWRAYGGKHYESVYTRFYQGHVLPSKFGIDKRRGHYSDLINSSQMTRTQALTLLSEQEYPEDLRRRDEEFVLKKLQLSRGDYEKILRDPPRTYRDYRNSYALVQLLRRGANFLRSTGLYPR